MSIRFLFYCLFSASLLSASFAQGKKTIDLDSELSSEEGESKNPDKQRDSESKTGNIKDKQIDVTGEDEQLIEGKKKDSEGILPGETKTIEWEQTTDQIVRKEKKGVKEVEKRAQIKAEYGSYNSLGVDIYITKRDKDGIYLLEYNREKADAEGFGRDTTANSEHSIDNIKLVSGFNLSPAYKLLIKTSYRDNLYALQSNVDYLQQFKRGGILDIQNQLRASENQKLDITLHGEYIAPTIEQNTGTGNLNSAFSKVEGGLNWQYILGPRNAISAGSKLWYGENETYFNGVKEFYRVGNAHVWDVFTPDRSKVGAEQTLLQLDVRIGARVFFATGMEPVIGPIVALDTFFGAWHSKLSAERKGYVPDTAATFLERPYFKPQQYSKPENKWEFWWKNRFKFNKTMSLKADLGYELYKVYYNPTLDPDELYTYSEQEFNVGTGRLAWEHNISQDAYYETGVKGEYHDGSVNLRTPLSAFVKAHYLPGAWDLGLEVSFIGERDAAISTLAPYFLLNASIERRINDTIHFFVRGENLFNEKYLRAPPYETSGLKAFGGIFILL